MTKRSTAQRGPLATITELRVVDDKEIRQVASTERAPLPTTATTDRSDKRVVSVAARHAHNVAHTPRAPLRRPAQTKRGLGRREDGGSGGRTLPGAWSKYET